MNALAQRLAALDLPPVAAPVAAYVPAVRCGNLIYTSGQLPMVDGALPATGLVGESEGCVSASDAHAYARQCARNALAAAAAVAGGAEKLGRVVKVTGFVASEVSFTAQAGVINGASEYFAEVFESAHARSAVGVAVLPLNSPVEVEVIFELA
ncbi:MAG: RidA family protein [Buchananella hordeovulneris]|nr:RidA family protein [Buchananella hordeovulneris]